MNNAPPLRTIDGIRLTEEQYTEYATISGQMAKKRLDMLVKPGFERFPAAIQRKMIGLQIKQSRDFARDMVMKNSMGQGDHDIIRRKQINALRQLQP